MSNTLSFRGLKLALRLAEGVGMRQRVLTPDALEAAARRATGLSDFGNPYYREGLAVMLRSANQDADLNPYGRLMMAKVMTGQMINRLLLQRVREEQPDLLKMALIPPIIVTGLPRTGTTALHRLISADPDNRAIAYWELTQPLPRSPADTPAVRLARADTLLATRRKLTPELDATHYLRADSPEECMFLMAQSCASRLPWNIASVHSYVDWYTTADRGQKYREYAELLRILQAGAPGRRLALKAPEHVDSLNALLDAIPDAIVVQTHRDAVAQFASYLSLGEQTRRLSTDRPQRDADTQTNLRLTQSSITRNLATRARHPGRIIDVRYKDLRRDPTGVVEDIYGRAGLVVSDRLRQALAEHARANVQGKHGEHRYSLADYGLNEDDIAQRFADPLA